MVNLNEIDDLFKSIDNNNNISDTSIVTDNQYDIPDDINNNINNEEEDDNDLYGDLDIVLDDDHIEESHVNDNNNINKSTHVDKFDNQIINIDNDIVQDKSDNNIDIILQKKLKPNYISYLLQNFSSNRFELFSKVIYIISSFRYYIQ